MPRNWRCPGKASRARNVDAKDKHFRLRLNLISSLSLNLHLFSPTLYGLTSFYFLKLSWEWVRMNLEQRPDPGLVGYNYSHYPELDHAPAFSWSGQQETENRTRHVSATMRKMFRADSFQMRKTNQSIGGSEEHDEVKQSHS